MVIRMSNSERQSRLKESIKVDRLGRQARAAFARANPPRHEWYYLAPNGAGIVTRYYEPTEEAAWRKAVWFPHQSTDESNAKIRQYKAQGFRMSLTPPPAPPPPQVMVVSGLHLQDGR